MLRAFWDLTKPGITRLVLCTTAAGFVLGAHGRLDIVLLAATLVGTGLVVSGTNALNQWWEREADARMERTARRPLPSGALAPAAALRFGLITSAAGLGWLFAVVNRPTALLAALSVGLYVLAYTPLKRRTPLALFVGAVPGALPILGGWTAAGEGLNVPGAVLFGILFFWQIPHFLALGWLYRDDYRRGGFAMWSRDDVDGGLTGRQAVVFAAVLLVASLLPTFVGLAGAAYAIAASVLGTVMVAYSVALWRMPTTRGARRLFAASIVYLPALLLLLLVLP